MRQPVDRDTETSIRQLVKRDTEAAMGQPVNNNKEVAAAMRQTVVRTYKQQQQQ